MARFSFLWRAMSALATASVLAAGCSTESDGGVGIVVLNPEEQGGSAGAGEAGKGSAGKAQGGAGQGGVGQGGVSGSGPSAGSDAAGGAGASPAGQAGATQGGAGLGGAGQGGAGSGQGNTGGQAVATALSFTSPQEGQVLDQSGDPAEVSIHFEVQASADIAKVEYRIENGELMASSTSGPGFAHDHVFKIAGDRWVEATGFGADGAELKKAKVNFKVKAPSTGNACLDDLSALGVSYVKTKAKGVVDAVNIKGPINGVAFTSGLKTEPSGDPMACEFVKTLWAFAEVVKSHGFVRVGTLGSYCYRCCCSWSETNYCRGPDDPEPDCGSNGYSNHSWGRAVDVRYLVKEDGTTYDVNDPGDFVAYGGTDTCGAGIAGQSGISLEMYNVVCDTHKKKVFSTILTPNYNDAHRNHFHMDIGKSGPATGATVKIVPDVFEPSIDEGEHGDACGGAGLKQRVDPPRAAKSRAPEGRPALRLNSNGPGDPGLIPHQFGVKTTSTR